MCTKISALVIYCLLTAVTPCHGQSLHLVVITDDSDESIGASTAIDRTRVIQIFQEQLGNQLKLVEVPSGQMEVGDIIETLSNLRIQAGDSVCVYYSGHGSYTVNRQPMLNLGPALHETLPRGQIVDIVTPMRPYVFALITDCCASSVSDYDTIETSLFSGLPRTVRTPELLRSLFFDSPGFIDIASSKPYQVSMATKRGGVFTRALCQYLRRQQYERRAWDEVFRGVREMVASDFELVEPHHPKQPFYAHDQFAQKTQTPYSFGPMYGRNVNDARVGVVCDGAGFITKVIPGSIAQQQNLLPGERILRVNEHPIGNDRDLTLALLYSECDIELEVSSPTNNQRTVRMVLPW